MKLGDQLWILSGDENYKSEQRLLGIDQLNYEYSSEFVHFCNFHVVTCYHFHVVHMNIFLKY